MLLGKKLGFIGFLFLMYINGYAQTLTQTVRGQITDKQGKYSLIGANVVVLESNPFQGATTNESGYFKISNVPIGRQRIKISFLGYKEMLMPIVVTSGKEIVLNIELEEQVLQGKEVVITAERRKGETVNQMATVSARSFTVDETRRYAGSRNDPSRMAANYAGVSGSSDDRNDIIIRGNSPTGLLWRLNGVNIPNPNHFGSLGTTGGPVSILNNNTLDNSDFMTGAFPAEYGNALAGVFDLRMRNGNNEKHEFLGQVGFNGFELGAEGPLSKENKFSYMANYRYSTLGVFNKLGIDIGTGAAVPQYQDLSFNVNFPSVKYGKFTLFGVGGKSYVELLESKADTTKNNLYNNYGASDIYFGSNMGVIGLSHLYFFNNNTTGKLILAASGTQNIAKSYQVIRSGGAVSTNLQYGQLATQTALTFGYTINKKINSQNTVSLGFTMDRYMYDYADSARNDTAIVFRKLRDFDGSSYLQQAFAQWQYRFTDNLMLTAGLHYQRFTLNNTQSYEPRAGVRWSFAGNQSLSVGVGKHSQLQPIGIYFSGTQLPNGAYLRTNKNLDFTRSNHIVVAYDNTLAENLRVKAEAYYQQVSSAPVERKSSYYSLLNYGATFDNPNIDSLVNNGTGKNYGLELTLEKFFTKNHYFLITGSFFESKYKGSDGIERNTAFNGNYVTNALVGREWKIRARSTFAVDLKATFAGGKRYVPINLAATRLLGDEVYYYDKAYQNRLKDYSRTDIKFTYRLNGKKITQEWVLDIQNILNQQNVFLQEYNKATKDISQKYQLGLFIVPQYRILF